MDSSTPIIKLLLGDESREERLSGLDSPGAKTYIARPPFEGASIFDCFMSPLVYLRGGGITEVRIVAELCGARRRELTEAVRAAYPEITLYHELPTLPMIL